MGVRTATVTELWRMGAVQLAETIRAKDASAQEVVEAHLRRIEAVNPSVNAVTVVLGDEAIAEARRADGALARGDPPGRLHGVPFTVKENIDVSGTATTQGAKAAAGSYPSRDAPVVERLKAAGGIVIGRTNLPTFGVGWVCESELRGATRNPWDPRLTPGASSGGEAAAIATGMSPLGLGNDGFGSLRWPAQCCGIASLRPTLGRVPSAGTVDVVDLPLCAQLVEVQGPLARRVADLRVAYEIVAGPTWRDPWAVPAPLSGPAADGPIRVALVVDPARGGVASQVEDGVRKAADALADAGYVIDEVDPPSVETAARTALEMVASDTAACFELMAGYPPEILGVLRAMIEVAGPLDDLHRVLTFMTRQSLMRAWGAFQEEHPLVLAPISTTPPFATTVGYAEAEVAEIIQALRMTSAVNALGLPSVAVPVGLGDGLPQAVQIIGPRYREDLCLDAAEALEQRRGVITPIDPRPERRFDDDDGV